MAGKRLQQSPSYPMQPSYGTSIERKRDRTEMEVVGDTYMSVVQVAALNAVTQYAMESVRQCDIKRLEVMAAHPNLEAPLLTGLLYNHARLCAEVQNSIAKDWKRA